MFESVHVEKKATEAFSAEREQWTTLVRLSKTNFGEPCFDQVCEVKGRERNQLWFILVKLLKLFHHA
jgi:hypothetical protein